MKPIPWRQATSPLNLITGLLLAVLAVAAGNARAGQPTQRELDQAASSTEDWLMTNKSYDGQRYVNLHQITATNVAQLTAFCQYDSGITAAAQSSPLLYRGRFYLSIGQSTVSVDARTCKEIWRHTWPTQGPVILTTNRGVAIKEGKLVRGTADGYLIALDMASGLLLWQQQVTSVKDSLFLSMPTMIIDDAVIIGTAGADWGGNSWIGAFRLKDGTPIWRFDAIPAAQDAAADSWGPATALAHGGGSFWTPVSVDRHRNLLFAAVGNPAPDFYDAGRPGSNLYTNTVLALDLKSGKPVWTRQIIPHDTHDWDLTQASPLVSAPVLGHSREVVVTGAKDGRVRIVDRSTHQVLADLPISRQEHSELPLTQAPVHLCPGPLGGQEWSSAAYHPKTRIVVVPMVEWCGTGAQDPSAPVHVPGGFYVGGGIGPDPRPEARGVLAGIDLAKGTVRWRTAMPSPMLANVTTTAENLVFTADFNGTLYAIDVLSGDIRFRHSLGATAGGGVLSYSLDRQQYVAVVAGMVSGFHGGTGTTRLVVLGLPSKAGGS